MAFVAVAVFAVVGAVFGFHIRIVLHILGAAVILHGGLFVGFVVHGKNHPS